MKKFPLEYFYVDKDGKSYFKCYRSKKEERGIDPYTLASTPVIFDKDATLMSIFKLVENNPHIKPFLYYFDEFAEEIQKESVGKSENKLEYIRFYWYGLDKDDVETINMPKTEVDGVSKDGEKYGIELSPVYELKNCKIMIDDSLEIRNNSEVVVKLHQYPTLFQVLYGLFWEFSFFGSPSDRDEKGKEILESVKKTIKEYENE